MAFVATTYPDMSQLPYTTVSTGIRNPDSRKAAYVARHRILNTVMESGICMRLKLANLNCLSYIITCNVPIEFSCVLGSARSGTGIGTGLREYSETCV